MDIFGRGKIKYLEEKLRKKDEELLLHKQHSEKLYLELKDYKAREKETKKFKDLLNEGVPEEANARKNYFTDITTFYVKYFKSKIAHMISRNRDELQIFGRVQREDDFYRAQISVLDILDEWFNHAERQYLSDLEEARQKAEENLASVDQINRKYNL